MSIYAVGYQIFGRDLDKVYSLLNKMRKNYYDELEKVFSSIISKRIAKNKDLKNNFDELNRFIDNLPVKKAVITINVHRRKNYIVLKIVSNLNKKTISEFFENEKKKFGLSDKSFVDIFYQNKTDAPEDISKKIWERRGDIWAEIYSTRNKAVPFIFKFFSEEDASELKLRLLEKYYKPKLSHA